MGIDGERDHQGQRVRDVRARIGLHASVPAGRSGSSTVTLPEGGGPASIDTSNERAVFAGPGHARPRSVRSNAGREVRLVGAAVGRLVGEPDRLLFVGLGRAAAPATNAGSEDTDAEGDPRDATLGWRHRRSLRHPGGP